MKIEVHGVKPLKHNIPMKYGIEPANPVLVWLAHVWINFITAGPKYSHIEKPVFEFLISLQ